MNDNRPNPDELLKAITLEENKNRKGHLKIFLGMAAGVGKTYAMLEAGQKQQREGVDVLIGIISTHGRQETAQLMEGLKVLPLKSFQYKDTHFEEFDIDEVLRIKPALVLVDELAHSNVPGSRHPKRWQDVIEILDNGIDVYTTINVQHIESLKDIVESITGIVIRETVPDIILETATYIELIDLTPTELLQRLKEGRVYLGNQSEIAARNFFKEDRLTALREIVLRFTAEKVDHELHGMLSTIERTISWRPREKLMVAISPSPNAQKLIRTTRRLAFTLNAPWVAINVNTGTALNENDTLRLEQNLSLARELGAEVIVINDTDIADSIQRIARQKGITQIIVGRAPKRPFLDFFTRFNLVDRLSKECVDIDIHVIRQPLPSVYAHRKKAFSFALPTQLSPYLIISVLVCLISAICWLIVPAIGYRSIGYIFLLNILFFSFFFRIGPVFLAASAYALIWSNVFIPSMTSFILNPIEDQALLCLFLLVSLVTGLLNENTRKQKEMLLIREATARSLLEITREMAMATSIQEILNSLKERLGKILHGTCEVLIKHEDNGLSFDATSKIDKDEKEKNAALWVFENGKEAGWSTNTLPSVKNLYVPLRGFSETIGVLAFKPNANINLNLDEKNFMYTVGQQLATYLERLFSKEKERHLENLNQIDVLYQSIFKSISEQLQAPLLELQNLIKHFKINTNLSFNENEFSQLTKMESLTEGLVDGIENISIMAKLTAGLIPNKRTLQSIEKIINKCLDTVKTSSPDQMINVTIQENLPLVHVDSFLIELLLYNLIYNAIEFNKPNSLIEIEAAKINDTVVISVLDEGKGIPEELLDTIFERLYRIQGTETQGVGLGLAIAKTIAELHHGKMKAANRPKGGAKISFILPLIER